MIRVVICLVRLCFGRSGASRIESVFGCDLQHQGVSLVIVIVYDSVEDSIFYGAFYCPDYRTAGYAERLHDLVAVHRGFEIADMVTLVKIDHLSADKSEILKNATDFFLILRCDVGLTQCHEILDVVAGIMDEATDG